MPRFTTKLFTDLAIWMIIFGLLTGISFPFFALWLGLPAQQILTPKFWMATLGAGLLLGTINYMLARRVVRPRLQLLANHMHVVESTIRDATFSGNWRHCSTEHCRVAVDSNDEIGESARAFNDLVEALFRSKEVEQAVSDFSKTLSSQLELDLLSSQALEMLLQHTNALAGALLIEKSGRMEVVAQHGLDNPAALADSDYVRKAMRTRKTQCVEFPEGVQVEAVMARFCPKEIIVTSVEFKENSLGVIILASNQAFNPEVSWLLELFRQGFGLALNNALIHAHLQHIAALDALTGAYNRRFGMARLHEEFNRSNRSSAPLGLIMVDLDHFKHINDTYGHLIGDRVLHLTSDSIRNSLRGGDLMIRYGGEEFLVVLPAAKLKEATDIAERIRCIIAKLNVQDGEQTVRLTASFGVSAYPEDNAIDIEELISHVDTALYQAKAQGRNQVVIANTNPGST
ncbi:sensor domain-containing diguanylate cyclase [Candidatus Venteria ishoeyi]|uniref:diguanylate cyclase n=1 Tax=Candidatus Venteria ishoeyi TaxID=1899563 RepID=A0A1H6FC68_9GAMM|nr:diguanylate cyclase [Candidatus Venteria ishoeyi]MDM8548027.1 diguanylate cyclase [Candidatus Venteria ishoeyi]SEH06605.1 putative diguanylate cyclase YedQ [Candidatus Venteria ishoeyi]